MKIYNLINFSIFIVIIIIILVVVVININKYKKDKYIINNYYKQEDYKQEDYKKKDYNGCTNILPEELFNIKGKLKASSQTKFVFKPELVTDPVSGKKIMQFKPLRIYFMTAPYIPKKYNITNTEIKIIKEHECLITREKSAENNYSVEYKEEGFAILDDLEKKYLSYDPSADIDYPTKIKDAIKEIVETRWKPYVNINFIFVDSMIDSDIRINFNTRLGSNSSVGSDCCNEPSKKTKTTMNFAWFDVGTVLHEFGHALGLIHEHQSPMEGGIPRDVWNRQGLYKFYEPDMISRGINPGDPAYRKEADKIIITNVFSNYSKSDIKGTPFDQYSIMLYPFPYYVFVGGLYGKYPKGTRKNTILSVMDVLYISELYPRFDDENKPIPKNEREDDVLTKYITMYPWIA